MSGVPLTNTKLNYGAVWILAKRELNEYVRNKTRIISSLAQNLLFLLVFSFGFANIGISISGSSISSTAFIASGIAAITIIFTGMFGGMGVMRDKMFGFMKELIVAPVSRRTLMFGKTLGVVLQTLIQVEIVLVLSFSLGFFGYDLNMLWRLLLIIPVVILSSIGMVGMGITISTRMRDFQSFGLIQTFIVMPMFFLSGALFALNNVPVAFQIVMMFDPFTYSVDMFRGILLGVSFFPLWLDLLVMSTFAIFMLFLSLSRACWS